MRREAGRLVGGGGFALHKFFAWMISKGIPKPIDSESKERDISVF